MNNKKIFVDATQAYIQFYFLILGLLIFISFSFIYYLRSSLNISEILKASGLSNWLFISFLGLVVILPMLFIISTIFVKLKYGIYRKIITDDSGISFLGLRKQFHLNWDEIVSLDIRPGLLLGFIRVTTGKIKIVEVRAKKRVYYFPLSMKEKGQNYPMYYYYSSGLIDKGGNKVKEIEPDDCPLYVEIQRHLKPSSRQ